MRRTLAGELPPPPIATRVRLDARGRRKLYDAGAENQFPASGPLRPSHSRRDGRAPRPDRRHDRMC